MSFQLRLEFYIIIICQKTVGSLRYSKVHQLMYLILRINYIFKFKMDFEIRLADSGHSETLYLEQSAVGETLISHISNVYKISAKDQFLLTKIGHRIRPQQYLKKVLTQQRHDKTMMGKDYTRMNQERISCIYLFNLKDISKPIQQLQCKFKCHWLDELKQEIKSINNLRPAITSYESLSQLYTADTIDNYPKAAEMIANLRNTYIKLDNQYTELKEIHAKIEQLMERCEKQRKSIDPLNHYLAAYTRTVKDKVNDMYNRKEILKRNMAVDDKSLRENSGYFEIKKKQENIIVQHEEKVHALKDKIQSRLLEVKEEIKSAKSKYRAVSQKIIDYGNLSILKQIDEKSTVNVNQYNKILHYFRLLVDSQDYKYITKIETSIASVEKTYLDNGTNEYQRLYKTLTDYYCQFSEFNERNRFIVRQNYRNLIKWKEVLLNCEKEVMEEINLISELTNHQNKSVRQLSFSEKNSQIQDRSFASGESEKSLESFKISIRTEAEVKRRVKFYKKLNYIQSLADKLCGEEEESRKKYLGQSKGGKENNKELLRNIKVPVIDIDYNGTSDLQVFKANKAASMAEIDKQLQAEQFMLIEYSKILEKVNKMPASDNHKIKNLQEILKSVSDIFFKIYHQKYQELNSSNHNLSTKFAALQEQLKDCQKEIETQQQKITEFESLVRSKQQLIVQLEKSRQEQIGKEKAKCDKLAYDKKKLQSELKTQIKLNEDLLNQIAIGDQDLQCMRRDYEEIKMYLGEKEVQIIKLEQQLASKTNKDYDCSQSQEYKQEQTDLKSVVIQNLSQKIQTQCSNHEQIIEQLKKENSLLQNENDLLQEQIESLSCQLRKIIMKQTEDEEVQVDSMSQSLQRKQEHLQNVYIGDEITIGQSAIFMPFSSNLYIGVCSRDEERTVCQMNSINQNHYILDLDGFNSKTRELLSQCSLLAIIKVQAITKNNSNFIVTGKIEYLLGFEDDNLAIKNYAPFIF